MNVKAVSGIMLTLLLIGTLTLAFNIQPIKAEPRIWTVDDDGPADFHIIQDAINAASDGDTIFVHNGTYYENVVVNKTITLTGENNVGTIIEGRTSVDRIANNVDISRFRMGSGITLNSSNNIVHENILKEVTGIGVVTFVGTRSNIISKNLIVGNKDGIHAYGTDHVIQENLIANNEYGIHTIKSPQRSDKIRIVKNIVTNNTIGININGYQNIVYKNIIANNSNAGIRLWGDTLKNMIVNNTIENNKYGILTKFYDNHHIIYGNTLSNNENGIYLAFSDDNTIYGNIVEKNEVGVSLKNSDYNSLHHNNFIRNCKQLYIYQSNGTAWDNGTQGNYWSDYEGNDNNGDGIGDTDIPHLGVDWYPLIEPFEPEPMIPTLKERSVGVKVGDWMKYDSDFTNFTYSGLELPPGYIDIKNREWIRNTVQEVSDPTVTFEMVTYYTNGTEHIEIKYTDVDYGDGSLYWFVSADLEPGDNIYTTSNHLIEETVSRTYAGVTREVSHLTIETIYYKPAIWPPPDGPDRIIYNLYWDKSTGVLCEWLSDEFWTWGGTSLYMFWSIRIVDTNLWTQIPIPVITMISPQNTSYSTDSVPLTFKLNEQTSWIGYSLDNQANVTITGNTTLTDLAIGPHNVIVYANDTYGNIGSSGRVHFTITEKIPGDIDGDGDVDWYDRGLFGDAYLSPDPNPNYNILADLDGDGDVDWIDRGYFGDWYLYGVEA